LSAQTGHVFENIFEPEEGALRRAWPKAVERDAEHLFAEHYEALVLLARRLRRRRQLSNTLMTSDLVHEAFFRLRERSGWTCDEHFLRTAACAMRHVAIDRARRRLSQKRGGGAFHDEMSGIAEIGADDPGVEDVIEIARLLDGLSLVGERLVQVIDCRYFAGYTEVETAEILGVDARTVRRDWNRARAWLATQLAAE